MICPRCGADDDKVIDSRAAEDGYVVRRRRVCSACEHRYTTYERVERRRRLVVVKKDNARVPFDRSNILRGLQAACGKRPISEEVKEGIVDAIEAEIHQEFDREVPSREIGERVAAQLRAVDDIAYIRYASEYHSFRTIEEFVEEVTDLKGRTRDAEGQDVLFDE
ncbi:MAG: transcriptional regulator NrdR [Phycisphaerales bacterium]|nr:transcriptional regulator NrdR [Phycisphaerales bacterium]